MLPCRPTFGSEQYLKSFTPSQLRAYTWVFTQLDHGKQMKTAVIGPAGTGKSYLLNGMIEMFTSHSLVTSKLAPSGVAAHLIRGTTVHNFFALDVECNSTLENGTVQVTRLRMTDVIVIDEFSMLDFFLFRTAEGLCRKFAKHGASNLPWGGRHVILLGDPAQLPAVSQKDIFGTKLWHTFTVMLLREVKRSSGPLLSSILAKIRLGVCDDEVKSALRSRLRIIDISALDLDHTVVICSKRIECESVNDECLQRLDGPVTEYMANDTDNNGNPLRQADHHRIQMFRERLPNTLQLKLGA